MSFADFSSFSLGVVAGRATVADALWANGDGCWTKPLHRAVASIMSPTCAAFGTKEEGPIVAVFLCNRPNAIGAVVVLNILTHNLQKRDQWTSSQCRWRQAILAQSVWDTHSSRKKRSHQFLATFLPPRVGAMWSEETRRASFEIAVNSLRSY